MPSIQSLIAFIRFYRWTVFFLVLISALIWAVYDNYSVRSIQPLEVTSGTFIQTIVASGHVESPHRVSISAQITGTVSDTPVVEGQFVTQGQALIVLENHELQSSLKQAKASEQQALTNLRQLHELKMPVAEQTKIQAQANFINAKNSLSRSLELYQKGFIGVAAKDEAERAYQIAESQLDIGQHQYDSLQRDGSEIASAQAALKQASAVVDVASARLQYSTIRAQKSGTLISRNVEIGDGVMPGKVLMTLSPIGTTQLVMQIDEKNIKGLKIGQMAMASADAFPQLRFLAKLVYINPSIDAQRGSVQVKLDAIDPPAELKQDMTVSVDIQIQKIDGAMLLAVAAIHDANTSKPWVYVIENNMAHQRLINTENESQGVVHVIAGLKAGDLVVPAQLSRISDGSRLRIAKP